MSENHDTKRQKSRGAELPDDTFTTPDHFSSNGPMSQDTREIRGSSESESERRHSDMEDGADTYRRRKALMMTFPNGSIADSPEWAGNQHKSGRKGKRDIGGENGHSGYTSENTSDSDLTPSTSDEVELSRIRGGEDMVEDEENGLTKHDKRKRRRRREQKMLLGERIAGSSRGKKEQSMADKSVLKASIINVLLIASWYCFSLSISIVSPVSPDVRPRNTNIRQSITSGCSQPNTSTSNFPSSRLACTC